MLLNKIPRILKIFTRLKTGKHIFPLLTSIIFLSIAMSINVVLLPLILYQNHVPTSLIGFSSATDILGGLVIIHILHKLGKKIGIFNSILLFGFLSALMILILPFYQNFILWLLLVFVLGTAIFSIITLRSAWINITVKSKIRSMVIAASSTALCLGFTIGPIIIKFSGADNYYNFVISAICILIACLILFPIRKFEPRLISHSKIRLIVLIKRNPQIAWVRFLTDLQCGAIIFFTVIYGVKNGMSAENAGLLISIFSGIGILDFLIGFLVKSNSYQRLILQGFIAFFIIIIILPLAISDYYFTAAIYLALGWITSLVSICCWYGINFRRQKRQLIFINSSFQAIGLFGGFVGNLMTGIFMQYFGKHGFVIAIALASLVYLLIVFRKSNQV